MQKYDGNSVNFVWDGFHANPTTSTPPISASATDPTPPDAASSFTFPQLLQLVKSLSDMVANLTAQVQLLVKRQDSASILPSPSISPPYGVSTHTPVMPPLVSAHAAIERVLCRAHASHTAHQRPQCVIRPFV